MEEQIFLKGTINVLSSKLPIRFFHCKSEDRPENHILHLNNYVEIYIYVSGNHHYVVENSLYRLKEGDVVIVNPREVHKAVPLTECTYERFYFLLDEKAFLAMEQDPLAPLLSRAEDAGNLVSMGEEKDEFLTLLYEISNCFCGGRNEEFRAFGYFMRALDMIRQRSKCNTCFADESHPTPLLLKKILAYVAEHIADIRSTAEIASCLGVTPQHLSSYFSKHIGTSLKTFIQAKKIALAKELLGKGANATEACFESGFNDCSYFIRIFKKYVGKTPVEYKKSLNVNMR